MFEHILVKSEIDNFLKEIIQDIEDSGYTIKEIISFLNNNNLCFPNNPLSEMRVNFTFNIKSKIKISQKKTLEITKIFNDSNFAVNTSGNWEIIPIQTITYLKKNDE